MQIKIEIREEEPTLLINYYQKIQIWTEMILNKFFILTILITGLSGCLSYHGKTLKNNDSINQLDAVVTRYQPTAQCI